MHLHSSLLFFVLFPDEFKIVVQVDDICRRYDQAPQEVLLVGFRLAQILRGVLQAEEEKEHILQLPAHIVVGHRQGLGMSVSKI